MKCYVRSLWLLMSSVCLGVGSVDAAQDPVAQDPVQQAPRDAEPDLERVRATHLREIATLLELGLPGQVVEYGLVHVRSGGALSNDGRAVAFVARALFDVGRESDAEELLRDAHVDAVSGAAIELEWARIDLERDALDRALARLVEKSGKPRLPLEPDAWILTARVLARRGDLSATLPYLRRFIELAPFDNETVAAFHLLHLEAAERHDADGAARYLAESQRRRTAFEVIRARTLQVRAAPDDPLPLYGLALALLELGDAALAAGVLDRLVVTHPEFQRAWFQLGEARRLRGDAMGALAAFDEGVARDPADHKCRLNRALLRLLLGDSAAARKDFEFLRTSPIAGDPTYSALYLGLARLYDADGDAQSARQAYERYRELGGTEPLVVPR